MARKKTFQGCLVLVLIFLSSFGRAEGPPSDASLLALEGEVLSTFERFAPEGLPPKQAPLEKRVEFYLDSGLWRSAEALLLPPSKETNRLLLRLYLSQGKYERVALAYQRDSASFPTDPEALLAASRGALIQRSYAAALLPLRALASSDERVPERLYLSALAYLGLEDWKDFDRTNREALLWTEKAPPTSETKGWTERFHLLKGDINPAIQVNQRERLGLRREMDLLSRSEGPSGADGLPPPVSSQAILLRRALLDLQDRVGSKKEILRLLQKLESIHRQEVLFEIGKREKDLRLEDETLRARLIRRCLTVSRPALPTHDESGDFLSLQSQARQSKVRNSVLLYQEAREAARQGKTDRVEASLMALAEQDPNGRYWEETLFRLGDIAFDRGDYARAAKSYHILLSRPISYLFRLALYKAAWSAYLQGKTDEVILFFLQQRALEEEQPGSQPQSGSPCDVVQPREREEWIRLLDLALRSKGGPAQLANWLEGKKPEGTFPILFDLAGYYDAAGETRALGQLVQSWVATYPLYRETPRLQNLTVNRPGGADTLTARIAFIETYRPGSPWAEANPAADVGDLLKGQIASLMTHYEDEAERSGRPALYQKALPWYRLYLELFPTEQETGEVRFRYAALLEKMGEAPEAADAYRVSAYRDRPHRYSAEAAARELAMLEKIYPPLDPNLAEAYSRFLQAFPTDKRTARVNLKRADQAFQKGAYAESRRFAEETPFTGEEGWASRMLVARAYLKEEAYPRAIETLQRLLSGAAQDAEKSGAVSPKRTEEARALLSLTHYRQGEVLKQKGEAVAAADAFWEAYREGESNKEDRSLAPLALFEAATLWGDAGVEDKAESALATFARNFPRSELYPSVLLKLGALYRKSDRPEEGARVYETAARAHTEPAVSFSALEEAIGLYEKAGRWEKVRFLATDLAARPGGTREKQLAWKVKGAEASLKLGDEKGARKMLVDLLQAAGSRKDLSEASSLSINRARLLLADSEKKGFDEIRLVAPLEKNLKRKRALFERLLKEYGLAADPASPALSLTATYRIGELFEEFSRALLRSERPRKLAADEKEAYERLLVEQALPYLQRAKESYERNVNWAKQTGVENEWVTRSRDRLDLLHREIASFAEKGTP